MYTLLFRRLPTWAEARKSQDPSVGVVGAAVAEDELVYGLLQHGEAGRMLFLVPRVPVDPEVEAARATFPNRDRVGFVSYHGLRELRDERVVVFSPDGLLTYGAHLRAVCGDPRWVVSAVTHSLSSWFVASQALLLHLQRIQPHDSLVCTSAAGREAFAELLRSGARRLSERLQAEPACRMQLPVIPLPAPAFRAPLVPRDSARYLLGLPPGKTVFLYFGRLSDDRKADLRPLLLAFAEACARVEDAFLVLAGDDTQRQAVTLDHLAAELGVKDRVHVRSDPDATTKAWLYSAADVFVSLSDNVQETFGLTLLEAMSAGLPVIAADWSGYRDIVRPGETGYLIRSSWADCVSDVGAMALIAGDPEAYWTAAQTVAIDLPAAVAAMVKLAGDARLREKMGRAAREVVARTFSSEAVVRQYDRLFAASLEEARSVLPAPEPVEGLTANDYFRTFGHFASERVTLATTFRISAAGRKALVERHDLPGLDGDRSGFARSRLLELLGRVAARGGSSAAAILGEDGQEPGLRHLLRLAKYGLLEVVPSA